VRKVLLGHHKMDLKKRVNELGGVLGDELLQPTRIYVKTVLNLTRDFTIGGIAHITGGGITGNVPRVIPKGCRGIIHKGTWDIPPIFPFLQEKGGIPEDEMYRTFNNGIGMVLIVRSKDVEDIVARLRSLKEKAFVIGEIDKAEKDQKAIEFV